MTERYVRPSVTTSLTREIKIHECTALIDATFLPFVFFFLFFSFLLFVSYRFGNLQKTRFGKLGRKMEEILWRKKSKVEWFRLDLEFGWSDDWTMNFVSCNRDIYFEFLIILWRMESRLMHKVVELGLNVYRVFIFVRGNKWKILWYTSCRLRELLIINDKMSCSSSTMLRNIGYK